MFASPFNSNNNDEEETSYFSFSFLFRLILIVVIGWFMWVNLANNGEFNLGMGSLGETISNFFKSMEEKGRSLYSSVTGDNSDNSKNTADGHEDEDEDEVKEKTKDNTTPNSQTGTTREVIRQKRDVTPPIQWHSESINRNIPVPPPMTNSADKKPGFLNEDTKYTFLDKAVRNYSGPSPSADDSTSKTQKHQSGKAGYCYIGEDRGFRSCIKVEAGDTCMSGDVYSRHDICVNPSLRE
jgi:hypothetical protein